MQQRPLISRILQINSVDIPEWKRNDARGELFDKYAERSALVRNVIGHTATFDGAISGVSPHLKGIRFFLPVWYNRDTDQQIDALELGPVFGEGAARYLKTASSNWVDFIKNKLINPVGLSAFNGLALSVATAIAYPDKISLPLCGHIFASGFGNGLAISPFFVLMKNRTYQCLRHSAMTLDDSYSKWEAYNPSSRVD